jgi:hypothetical protein
MPLLSPKGFFLFICAYKAWVISPPCLHHPRVFNSRVASPYLHAGWQSQDEHSRMEKVSPSLSPLSLTSTVVSQTPTLLRDCSEANQRKIQLVKTQPESQDLRRGTGTIIYVTAIWKTFIVHWTQCVSLGERRGGHGQTDVTSNGAVFLLLSVLLTPGSVTSFVGASAAASVKWEH